MQLTPKPVTAQWGQVSNDHAILRIINYVGEIITQTDGRLLWKVSCYSATTGPRELDWGIHDEEGYVSDESRHALVRAIVEDIIEQHFDKGGDA